MLYIPAGTYTLTARLWIKKSNIVIRGAGAGQTILYIPKSERAGTHAGGHISTMSCSGYATAVGCIAAIGSLAGLGHGHCCSHEQQLAPNTPDRPLGPVWQEQGQRERRIRQLGCAAAPHTNRADCPAPLDAPRGHGARCVCRPCTPLLHAATPR